MEKTIKTTSYETKIAVMAEQIINLGDRFKGYESDFKEKFNDLSRRMDDRFDSIIKAIEDLKDEYATKEEVGTIRKDMKELKELKGWAIKLVFGFIILGILGLLFKANI